MKGQAHMIAAEEAINHWPNSIRALCGKFVHHPQPVMTWDVEGSTVEQSERSLYLCRVCTIMAFAPVQGVRYVYAVLPAEEAHRLNLANRVED